MLYQTWSQTPATILLIDDLFSYKNSINLKKFVELDMFNMY